MVGSRLEGLAHHPVHAGSAKSAAPHVGPGEDSLHQPTLGSPHVSVRHEDETILVFDDASAHQTAPHPALESLRIAHSRVRPLFFAQTGARRVDQRIEIRLERPAQ